MAKKRARSRTKTKYVTRRTKSGTRCYRVGLKKKQVKKSLCGLGRKRKSGGKRKCKYGVSKTTGKCLKHKRRK